MSKAREPNDVSVFIPNIDPTNYNVEAIARLEEAALLERSSAERFSDGITKYIGSLTFVILHAALFLVWGTVNLGLIPFIPIFDPFPFGILTLIVSGEGVFLAIFILISQNRMVRQADRRMHLSLQVSMLAEQELTMLLKLQQKVCERLGVEVEPVKAEAETLMQQTDVERLVQNLEEKLPDV